MKSVQPKNITPSNSNRNSFFKKENRNSFFNARKSFFNAKGIQAKLSVNEPGDMYEQEADAMADHIVEPVTNPVTDKASKNTDHFFNPRTSFVQRACAECEQKEKKENEEENPIQEKSNSSFSQQPSAAVESTLNASKGSGTVLPDTTLNQMESSFGADFSSVRIHNDNNAAQMSKDLGAQAFTHGSDIYFDSGKFDANTNSGKHLLAHELTHTVQQGMAPTSSTVQRDPQDLPSGGTGPVDAGVPASGNMLEVPSPVAGFMQAPNMQHEQNEQSISADINQQVAAFKKLVLITAINRLAGNRKNLTSWYNIVERLRLDEKDALVIRVAQIQEYVKNEGGLGEYTLQEGLSVSNPIRRELKLSQAEGRNRACSGCHMDVMASTLDAETPDYMKMGSDWTPLADRMTGIPSQHKPYLEPWMAGSKNSGIVPVPARQTMNGSVPSPEQMERINALTKSYRIIIDALGPTGYQVWPASSVAWDSQNLEGVRSDIISAIDQRFSDYLNLMYQISNGEREYLEFQPILQDLLPLASPDVQLAIQSEIEKEKNKNLFEKIVVGIATIGALLLTIFPPTTALGVAALSALEVGLGAYAIGSGLEMWDKGQALSLGTGANNVYTIEQQKAAGSLMFWGLVNIITGPLTMGTGMIRGVGASSRIAEAGAMSALKPQDALREGAETIFGKVESVGPQVVKNGPYLVSTSSDGTMLITMETNPNAIIIVKDGQAVMYIRNAEGTLELAETASLNPGGMSKGGGLGIPNESQWPHVQQTGPYNCGAACGEMAACRFGVEVNQSTLAGSPNFTQALIKEGEEIIGGGFNTQNLAATMEELAPIKGRVWTGVNVPGNYKDAASFVELLGKNFNQISGGGGLILRVAKGKHWIMVDEVTEAGLFAVRDPARNVSTLLTADELVSMAPIGDVVASKPAAVP